MTSPLLVLGVSRSGTTLLRVVLDRSPGLAIPDESFFVPLLARRHRGPVDPAAFLDDLARLPVLAAWGLSPAEVAPRLRPGQTTGEAIAAVFEAYAAAQGKPRWGDKTPMYLRHLPLLERLFPEAQYVHLVRDGRDAWLSFRELPAGTSARTWAHPTSARAFACLWRTEVEAARALGARVGPSRYLEARYEELVSAPETVVGRICAFADVPFESAMLEYSGAVDVSRKPHQQRLLRPPTAGLRDWRTQLAAGEVRAFEDVAGRLLADLGYELAEPPARPPSARAQLALATYRVRLGAWNAAVAAVQRSPLWRRRHPRLAA
ncbi:MAG TPA: sulfotransferase [Gaiellaceae bacterium]|nr:sulfotransferase [Gaiellaceae bacterium]